jgi:hypothetical protein
MKFTLKIVAFLITAGVGHGAVLLQTGFGPLRDSGGGDIPLDSTTVLISSSDANLRSFSDGDSIKVGDFIGGGNDLVLGVITLVDGGIGTFANSSLTVENDGATGNPSVNDNIFFVFFPSNRGSAAAGFTLGATEKFGVISSGDGTSDPFVVPANGQVSYTNSDFAGGSFAAGATVIPEPSSALLMILGLGMFVRRRR